MLNYRKAEVKNHISDFDREMKKILKDEKTHNKKILQAKLQILVLNS